MIDWATSPAKSQVIQCMSRANGIGSLISGNGELTRQGRSLVHQVETICRRGYQRVGLITHRRILPFFKHLDLMEGYFYGERGTNRFAGKVDALIVGGTPMPPMDEIAKMARCLYLDRMAPLDLRWSVEYRPYPYRDAEGNGWSAPVPGFWHDPPLQALLEQVREAEIYQSAWRARPLSFPTDIWILSNIPYPSMTPHHLVTVDEILGTPEGVHPEKWYALLRLADERYDQGTPIKSTELVELLNINRETARKYIDLLVEHQPDRWGIDAVASPRRRGRPSVGLVPYYPTEVDVIAEYGSGEF